MTKSYFVDGARALLSYIPILSDEADRLISLQRRHKIADLVHRLADDVYRVERGKRKIADSVLASSANADTLLRDINDFKRQVQGLKQRMNDIAAELPGQSGVGNRIAGLLQKGLDLKMAVIEDAAAQIVGPNSEPIPFDKKKVAEEINQGGQILGRVRKQLITLENRLRLG